MEVVLLGTALLMVGFVLTMSSRSYEWGRVSMIVGTLLLLLTIIRCIAIMLAA